jgi:hypothetical protein
VSAKIRRVWFWVVVFAAVGIGLGLIAVGCATSIHGTNQDVTFSSTPTGAMVTVDNIPRGNAPTVVKLSRKESHVVKIELAGYQPFELTITRHVSGWVWGNIIFGGLIGLAVDAISGGMYNLTPELVGASLAQGGSSLLHQRDVLYVAIVMNPDSAWEQIGTLERTSKQ